MRSLERAHLFGKLSHAYRSECWRTLRATNLQAPLIDDPSSHSAVISVNAARQFGLPAEAADPSSESWSLIWSLWTRYFAMGCFPAGPVAIYEGRRASHALYPDQPVSIER